jgi:hypothetical protein
MTKTFRLVVPTVALVAAGVVTAQGLILDLVADKVINKYQSATCEQLWENKSKPKTEEEQRAVQFLRSDPTARKTFIDKVAAPVVNKMFECGMVP